MYRYNNVESTVENMQINCDYSEVAHTFTDVQHAGCETIGELLGNVREHFVDFILRIREQHSLPVGEDNE